jgi:hypothetical protein
MRAGACPGSRGEAKASGGKACLFLKKSRKKLLVALTSARPGTLSPEGQTFFGSFFKKEPLSSACFRIDRRGR